jgi:flagellar basal-body rod protein FlgF
MFSGLYSSATAMEVASRRHELTAENLAHLQAPGFRRRVLPQATFASVMAEVNPRSPAAYLTRLGTAAGRVQHDFSTGPMMQTGRKLDVAIQNDGFFAVDGPDGVLYTRSGAFQLTPDGMLTIADGLPILGSGGPIVLPPDTSSEALSISPDGRLSIDGVEFAQLSTYRFEQPQKLVAAGASLFSAPDEAGVSSIEPFVQQGMLEKTNVSAVREMVAMIENNRQYEAAQRTMKAVAELTRQRIGLSR